jgi:hypothetical protein
MSSNAIKAAARARDFQDAERNMWPGFSSPGPGLGAPRIAAAVFNPSANSGERTVAAHSLGLVVPAGAIVTRAWADVLTAFTSAGANAGTIALHLEAAGDLATAVAIASQNAAAQRSVVGSALFDPSANTGERTVAAHGLGVAIPSGAYLTRAWYDVLTTFTSGDPQDDLATIALHAQSANDLVTAVAINDGGGPWDAGLHAITVSAPIKMTAARELTATVAVAALTAGKLRLFAEYMEVLADGAQAPWGLGRKVLSVTPFKTTVERTLTATVAAQALTAGKANVYVEYFVAGA